MRFIVNFVIPVFRATRQMKQQVRDFNEKMGQKGPQTNGAQAHKPPPSPTPKAKSGDYIDFEEVRN
jgi:hypothetical protein